MAILKPELFADTPEGSFSLTLLFDRAIKRNRLQGLRLDGRQKAAAVAAWKESLALNPQQPRVQEMLNQWSR